MERMLKWVEIESVYHFEILIASGPVLRCRKIDGGWWLSKFFITSLLFLKECIYGNSKIKEIQKCR